MAVNSFTIDTRSLQKLVADLQASEPGIKEGVNVGIRGGAAIVVGEAVGLSSWSSRIPGSIRVVGAGTRVLVRAGGARAPHAAAYEHGGVPGSFRHPVFGNRAVWVTQAARPFLFPTWERKQDDVIDGVVAGVDTALRSFDL